MGTLSPGNTSSWVWFHTLLQAGLSSTHSWPIYVLALSVPSMSCFLLLKVQKINPGRGFKKKKKGNKALEQKQIIKSI